MRRLDLEFQPRRSGPLVWSLLVLASAMVAGLVLLQQRLQTEQVALEASVHSLELQPVSYTHLTLPTICSV